MSDHIVTICVPSQQVEELLTELVRGAGVDTAILTMNASRCHFPSTLRFLLSDVETLLQEMTGCSQPLAGAPHSR